MAKKMVYDAEARQPLAAGVSKLARAVRSTLGPRAVMPCWTRAGCPQGDQGRRDGGRRDRVGRSRGKPRAQLVKEAASKTNDVAGDGTTTATVLAEAIYRQGLKMIAGGADPMALSRGIHKATEAVIERSGKWPRRSTKEQEGDRPNSHDRR